MKVVSLLSENRLPLENPGICGGDISKAEVHYIPFKIYVKDLNFQFKDFQKSLSY
jgi:hypothetical protein